MSRSWRVVALTLAALLLGGAGQAAPPKGAKPGHKKHKPPPFAPPPAPLAPPPVTLRSPPLAIETFSMDNGLRVVLCPQPGAATVSLTLAYDAGSQREARGASGLANLLRHSAGLGSANLLRGEHEKHLSGRGGRAWSELSTERVAFVSELPPGELALGLWLEADRLKSLQLSPDGVQAQRERLLLELQRRAANPLLAGEEQLRALVFQSTWPYEHGPAGNPLDLAALRPEFTQPFRDAFYTASNAVLVLVGPLEPETTRQLVHRFFETARRQDRPPPPSISVAEQTSQRSAHQEATGMPSPTLLFGWATPGGRTDDAIAFEAAFHVLARQRLPARLQHERPLAGAIDAAIEEQRTSALARLRISLLDPSAQPAVEKALDAEIEALLSRGPSDAELSLFRQHTEAQLWQLHHEPSRLSVRLADMELLYGDGKLLHRELPRAEALTREQVRAAAARYLPQARRSYVFVGSTTATAAPAPRPAPLPTLQGPTRPHHPPPPRPPRRPKPKPHR
ncbi:MAG: insulinase family protein [Polyangiaceae bacterium]|jgi:predicted Zn-dependent peptidase|nr:insulinase family protein [Polyangiaceae bacterium]